tara:strand:+ start:513 stop:2030 length:1518 start_codon:yes stop_codon:yes gene_type:complete
MATVGNLFINVKARTAGFSKKMKGVRATIGRLGTGLAKAGKKLALFGAALGAVALGAIVALTKKGLTAVDTMAKLAQNIGASVKSIQSLRHMATLGGVSVEKMDKAVSKMVRGIGESAVFGIGEANDAFKELGLSAKDLEKDNPDVAFGKIADAINNVSGKARQGVLAYKIFGRAGQELLTTLSGGSSAVTKMNEKLETLGVVIGDRQAQMVEKANDAWADIKLVFEGLGNQLAVNFAPILIEIANKLIDFVKQAGGMSKVAEFIVKAFMYVGAFVLDVINIMKIGWHGFKAAVLTAFGVAIEFVGIAVEKMANIWNKGLGLMRAATGTFMTATGKLFGLAGEQISKLNKEVGFYVKMMGLASQLEGRTQTDLGLADFTKNYKSELADFLKSIGTNIQDQGTDAAELMLDLIENGFSMGKVPKAFEDMIAKHLGEGFDKASADGLQLEAPDLKGIIHNLQTAIGGFKVEGDQGIKLQQEQLSVEKSQLNTLNQMREALAVGAILV